MADEIKDMLEVDGDGNYMEKVPPKLLVDTYNAGAEIENFSNPKIKKLYDLVAETYNGYRKWEWRVSEITTRSSRHTSKPVTSSEEIRKLLEDSIVQRVKVPKVRLDEERSDELITLALGSKTTRACTFI